MINNVTQGDTLEIMKSIPDNAIDFLLVDLPYGTTQNKWDSVIPLDQLWTEYHRIVKKTNQKLSQKRSQKERVRLGIFLTISLTTVTMLLL